MARERVSNSRTSSKSNKNTNVRNVKTETRAKSKKNKNNKKKFKLLIFIFLFAIIIACTYLLFNLSTFNIIGFKVEGTDKYTTEQITEKLNMKVGDNIFIKVLKCDKDKISELSYIETINFDLHLPNILNINISERVPKYFAYDKEKNIFFKLDKNGVILEEERIENKTQNELLIYGITFDDEVILGDKINEIDMSKILVFLEINEEFEKSKINRIITKVNFENSLTTLTLNDKLNVIFPNNDNLKYKMALLGEILKSIGEDAVGVVDLTKNDPTYSSF